MSLIAPLEVAGAYVPVLPKPLLDLLDAPQAYVLGAKSAWLPRDENRKMALAKGVVCVDLDSQRIDTAYPALPPAMRAEVEAATRRVRALAHEALGEIVDEDAASRDMALVAAEAKLQATVARHIVALLDPPRRPGEPKGSALDPRTRGVAAVARCAPEARPFARQLVDTQHVQQSRARPKSYSQRATRHRRVHVEVDFTLELSSRPDSLICAGSSRRAMRSSRMRTSSSAAMSFCGATVRAPTPTRTACRLR